MHAGMQTGLQQPSETGIRSATRHAAVHSRGREVSIHALCKNCSTKYIRITCRFFGFSIRWLRNKIVPADATELFGEGGPMGPTVAGGVHGRGRRSGGRNEEWWRPFEGAGQATAGTADSRGGHTRRPVRVGGRPPGRGSCLRPSGWGDALPMDAAPSDFNPLSGCLAVAAAGLAA